MAIVAFEVEERIGYITLNRPEKRNALSDEMVTALLNVFELAEKDTAVKVLVLRAEGKVFCAGADLAYLQKLRQNTYEENLADSTLLKRLFQTMYTFPKVIIAQVQGHAIAGGCGLATVCDFVYSAEHAKFGYTEVRIGFIPALVKVFLLRKIGEGRAKELLLSGDLITAEQALQYGIINKIFAEDALATQVKAFAQKLCENNSATSMQLTKQMIAHVQTLPLEKGLQYAAEQNAKARQTPDCQRGIDAFLNKEDLKW